MFSVQYNTITGDITGTVSGNRLPNDSDFPVGTAQLTFNDAFDVTGQKVDVTQTPPVLVPTGE